MIRSIFLMIALFSLIFCKSVTGQNKENTPNILLITLDDMNWDSPCSIAEFVGVVFISGSSWTDYLF